MKKSIYIVTLLGSLLVVTALSGGPAAAHVESQLASGSPTSLAISGPATVHIGVCSGPYTVSTVNSSGQNVDPGVLRTVAISGASAKLFATSDCNPHAPLHRPTLLPGAPFPEFYLTTQRTKSFVLIAKGGTVHRSTVLPGQLSITVEGQPPYSGYPALPFDFQVAGVTSDSISLAWKSGGFSTSAFTLVSLKGYYNFSNSSPCFPETQFDEFGNSYDPYSGSRTALGNVTSYTVSGLEAGQPYSFLLCAENKQAYESYGVSAQSLTDVNFPTAPTNVVVFGQKDTVLNFSWSYVIQTPAPDFWFAIRAGSVPPEDCTQGTLTHGSSSYLATGLAPQTQYSVSICTVNSKGVSPAATLTGKTLVTPPTPPPPPTGFAASEVGTDKSLILTWKSGGPPTTTFTFATASDGYYYNPLYCGNISIGNVETFKVTDLIRGSIYQLILCAKDEVTGLYSTPVSITVTGN